ncbi:ATP-binding protein [Bacteroides thetaiotaomicron]|uniref:ATP-binding response regulator n=1 Tax=Bacteroides thetaiotaomicron TaxID=818 RepID=UPI0039B3EF3C
MASFRSTKLKITIGYILLLAILLFSLVFVHQEMETLSAADDQQNLRTDSLLSLLHEKDQNTLQMLRVLSEANDSLLSASEIEEIISEQQDSVITQQRVQHRVITKRDSLITTPKKKGFFKRLGEVFAPSKKDTAVLVNTSLEVATDTILEPVKSADSLQHKIRMATEEKRLQRRRTIRRTSTRYQRMNTQLTARMDSLIKGYEEEMSVRARQDAELQQEVRMRSANIIAGIAIGAVFLSAFFLILIMRDITRSNRYRRQLEEANKRAEDLLVAREKLMLAITHDFKAPLGSIMGYTELLSRLTEDERQRFYLDNMKSSSEHLLKLVSDLLDFHRLDLNKAEVNRIVFNPAQLFEEIRVCFEPLTAAKGLVLQCHIAPELSEKYISDPLRIQQIVNNLLSNAVKFTQQGKITLTVGYNASKLTIAVADTGKGMASEDRERIFQEFTRLPGAQGEEGFGLGLSIVHKLVLLLEGTIDVQSTLGKGSCFTVVLPLFPVGKSIVENKPFGSRIKKTSKDTDASPEETDVSLEETDAVPAMKVIRVLLIDDDKIQLNLTAAMLKQHNIDAVCCEQLEELIEQLRSSTFDVLLTDIQMPAINGFDLVKLLRASNIPQARNIPVIAVTARSEMDEKALHEHGFAGCLHKPFTVKELLVTLNEGQRSADEAHITHDMQLIADALPKDTLFNFSALTAFSEDDPEAACSIIRTFIEETGKNADRMQQALTDREVDGIAAMAHKLLPLFTLIGASESVASLRWLESCRGEEFSEEVEKTTLEALEAVRKVVRAAEEYSLGLH